MAISSLPGAPQVGASAPPSTGGDVLASLPGAPKIAPAPSPTPVATPQPTSNASLYDSIKGIFGLSSPAATPAPVAPAAPVAAPSVLSGLPGAPVIATPGASPETPAAEGSEPADQAANKPGGDIGVAPDQDPTGFEGFPAATSTEPAGATQAPNTVPGKYYYGTDNAGNTIGASNETDASGVPYFAYRTPGATATTTDYTRVATTFDPTVAKPMTLASFYNARAVSARADLKTAMGGAYSDELDHTIALELGGSNNPANLRVESARTTPGGESYSFDQMENDLAQQVIKGQISLSKAQYTLAAAKSASGDKNPVPTVPDIEPAKSVLSAPNPQTIDWNALNDTLPNGQQAPKTVAAYAEEAQQADAAATAANSPSGLAKNTVGQIGNWAYTLGATVVDHLRASVSSPQGALATGEGAVQTAVIKPLAFTSGIASALLGAEDTGIDKLTGKTGGPAPINAMAQLASMNDNIDRTPDEQKAYDTGQFVGWMVPYGAISHGVQAAADASRVAEIVPKIAPLIPYISDAAGFLGTGQILHTPDEGTRVQQLKNDALALALFDVGGFALKGAVPLVAKGLGAILPAAVKGTADEAMKPVVEAIKEGTPISADLLDHAVTAANTAIEDSTGKTPQTLIQEHFNLNESPKIPLSPETTPAHNTIDKAIPMYHEQEMGRFQKGLDAINAAKAQLSTLTKQLKNVSDDPNLRTEQQTADLKKVASLREYIDNNKAFERYWSGTKPGDTEPRAQSVLHNMTDTQASAYHAKYVSDIKQHAALGYDMSPSITDQFAETKAPAAPTETGPDLHQAGHDTFNALPPETQATLLDKAKTMSEDSTSPYYGVDPEEVAADSMHTDPNFAPDQFSTAAPTTPEDAATKYWSDSIAPAIKEGKTIEVSGDAMKEHFGNDYAPEKSDMYSKASYQTMQKVIDEPSVHDITFLGGGPGAGKSEILGAAIKDAHSADVLYDNSFSNVNGARALIKQAEDAGKEVDLVGSIPDLDRAHAFTISRAAETGRPVAPGAFARGHAGFVQTLKALLEDGTLDPSQVSLYDFRGKTMEEAKAMVAAKDYVKDPLALLNELGYTEEDLANKYERISPQKENAEGTPIPEDAGADRGVLQKVGPQEAQRQIKLPDFPRRGRLVMGVAFPGADIIAKFIEKDVIEKFGGLKNAVKGIYDATKELLATNPVHEKAAAIVGSGLMEMEKFASSAWKVAEARRDWWAKVPEEEQNDFIDRYQSGTANVEGYKKYAPTMSEEDAKTLSDIAKNYRERLDNSFAFEGAAGMEENYIKDYYPQMWKEPEKAQAAFEQYFTKGLGSGYRKAFGSMTHIRIIALDKIGRELGLEPVTTNPEERVIMREIDGFRIATKINIMKQLDAEGLAHPLEVFEGHSGPSGWPLIKNSDGKMWAVTPDAAKVLNNAFFSKSFWTMNNGVGEKVMSSIFKTLMAIKGTVVPFQLSLSGFHPFHVQTIASADAITSSFMRVLNGNMSATEGMAEMAKGLSFVSSIANLKDYWNIGKAWDTPMDQLEPSMRTAVQYIIDGGGSPKISEEFKVRAGDGFKKAVSDENYIGAAIRGVPRIVEALQEPILGHYVPALKIGAYLSKAADLVHDQPELATDDTARKVAFRAAWKEVDSRFGEMVYKTKFWNPLLTQVGEASFLSLGWQLGFVDQFAGGALDLAKLAVKGVGGTVGLTEKATRADITSRSVFSIAYTIQAAMWGGLMTYAMTGKAPQSIQDLFYPNTGKINSDGSAARLNTPFYTREFFGLTNHIQKQGIVGGPLAMAQDKANPILNSLAEIWSNKDFYGYEIHDPNSSVPKQAEQVMAYLVKNNFTPISIQGAIQANNVTGRLGVAASIAGFNPAPKYIAENAIQTKIFATLDERSAGTKPIASQAAANAKTNIRKLYQGGNATDANTALKAAIAAGYIKPTGLTTFMKDADLPSDVAAFKDLTQYPSDQEALLSQMNESDLQRYAQYAASSVKANMSSLSPAAAQFVKDIKSGKIKVDTFKAGKVVTTP